MKQIRKHVVATWSGSSINRRILRAALVVGFASAIVKVAAMGKEVVLARVFGRSDAMDAFLSALLLPSFLLSIISLSMNQALVPSLVRVREEEGQERAQRLFSSAMLWSLLLLTAGMLAMGVAAPLVVHFTASNFGPEKMRLTIHIFYVLLPIVVLTGVGSNCAAVLNTTGKFAMPALVPIITPVAVGAAAFWFARPYGIWSAAIASVTGALGEAVALVWLLRRRQYKFEIRWYGMTAAVRQVARQYGFVLLGAMLSSSSGLVDQSMAAMLKPGSVSALVYGNRIISAIGQLLITALATSLTPHFSEIIAKKDWNQCRRTMRVYVRLTIAITLPVTLVLVFGSHVIVRGIYQRGAFGPEDTAVVALVQCMYALGLPFLAVGRVYYRFISAMNRNDIATIGGAVNLVLDIVFNLVCMRYLGVAGIALSTSMFYAGSLLFNMVMARRLMNQVAAPARPIPVS